MPRPNLGVVPPDEKRCTATVRRTGERCTKWRMQGLKVCGSHGGRNPVAKAAGQRRAEAERRTRKLKAKENKLLAHEGLKPVEDPLHELGKLTTAATELMHSLGKRVNALRSVEEFDDKNAPHIRVEAEMYERAIDRTARLLDMLVKHGYTERQVKVQEQEALMIAGVLSRVLAGLGLDRLVLDRAKELLAEEFRQLDTNQQVQGQVIDRPRN